MADIWADTPCPLFVGARDDPFLCAYDSLPYEAHSRWALAGQVFGIDPDAQRAAQLLSRH